MPRRSVSSLMTAAALCVAGTCLVLAQAQAPPAGPDLYRQLRYRYIGPVGNRVTSVAGIPGNGAVYYAGAASGGIFKTTDGGAHWEPIFDDQAVSSIGALAIAPSDPAIVWAGTGEAHIRSHISLGNGIYRSGDAGKTWSLMGLEKTGRIARIRINPQNPDVLLVCALGHAYGPQPERGIFRTTDGGKTWEKVLFVDENTGCSDLAMDPNNPRIFIAGMWQLEIHTWGRTSGGPGSGLFKSTDGGVTWRRLAGHGLPTGPVGKVAVAIAQSDSNRMYALIETGDGVTPDFKPAERGELWRSDDGGENWQAVSYDRQLAGRTHYYSRTVVNPTDADEAYFLSAAFTKTLDGGRSIVDLPFASSPGGDNHDLWIDPTSGDRMIVANDQGVSISITRGRTWERMQLPIAQMYHVTVDNQIPYYVYGNRQDGPSTRGPSNSLLSGGFGGGIGPIPRGMWHSVAGGESGFATPDPVDPNIIWSSGTGLGSVGGVVERFDERNRQARWVEVWPEATQGASAGDVKYRFNWEFPIAISPHDHNTVYVGSQHVHQTTDGGHSWQAISPDLTTNDKSRQGPSGGLTGDNIGVEYAGVVFAIAESPKEKGVIWAGTNDGLVHVTRDGGKTWTNVTKNIPILPPWGTVSNIDASRHDAGAAYITVDFHQVNNRDPFVYKTADYGRTWTSISSDIPRTVLSYAHCIREDPVRKGLLYLGTENALYVSLNDGQNWTPLQNNLPPAPSYWMIVQEHFNDLVVATYGRGFWILDDITPLQQLTSQVLASNAHLFAPRPAYRFRNISQPMMPSDDPTAGQNPPYGASINYYLKSAPSGDVSIAIQDGSGRTVRTIRGSKDAGINRVWWDLRTEASREIRLRTSPPGAPEVRAGAEGWRPIPGGRRISLLAPPATYTVKLTAGGREFTQPLVVRKDPRSTGTEADIQAQTKMMTAIRDDLNVVADGINQIESIRAQLNGLIGIVADDESGKAIRSAAEDLDRKLIGVEENFFQIRVTGRGQDMFRWPPRLAEKLTYLASGVSASDFPPTTQQTAVFEELRKQVAASREQLSQAVGKDVAAFNTMLREKGVQNILPR